MPGETPTLGTSVLEDQKLVEKARSTENGWDFRRLYDQGWNSPIVQRTYETPRHARLALVTRLVWWTRHDFDQIRRLFSRSALCPGDLTRYRDYVRSLVCAAVNPLGDNCYGPKHANDDTNKQQ